jgi:hypothetical protein
MSESEFPVNNPTHRDIARALHNIHEPAYLLYDIGTRFVMRLECGFDVIAYYSGFTGKDIIKFGTSKVPGYIFDQPHPSNIILSTHELKVARTVPISDLDDIFDITKDLTHLTMLEVQFAGTNSSITRIGYFKKTGEDAPTLAHSHSLHKDFVDCWYKPGYVPSERWLNPNLTIPFVGIEEVRVLEEI